MAQSLDFKYVSFLGYASYIYTNPVVEGNHPDPGVLKLPNDQGFVAVTTSNYDREGIDTIFPILYSRDLVSWEQVCTSYNDQNL